MTTPGGAPALVGRAAERAAVDEVLAAVRSGESGALVVHGEPGIGKSRVLRYAVEQAAPLTVLVAAGVEGEAQMAFAGLHRLLGPLLPRVAGLPTPQRAALDAVFGVATATAPDRFLVGLAVLTLLTTAAAEAPLVLAVDDAQWLDPESTAVMGFVARRLGADPVGVFVATRTGGGDGGFAGLPTREIVGLSEAEAAQLLAGPSARTLRPGTAARLVADTGGNPLAITELTRTGLGADGWSAQLGRPEPLPIATRLEEHFLQQVRDLPPDTRTLLLIAAADPTRDGDLVRRAAERFGITLLAADPAISADVFTVQPFPAFRHPLIRSAVYGGADPADRRRAHHALAAVTDVVTDPDRRAWHQAAAALGPDAAVAERLEHAAVRAGQRSGYSMRAAFLARAAALSPDRTTRSRRSLEAAQAHLVADELAAAERHLADALDELRDPSLLVRAQRLRAAVEIVSVRPAAAPAILLGAVEAARDEDPDLAWDMAFEASGAALLAGEYVQGTSLLAVARTVLDLPPRKGDPRTSDLLVTALSTRLAVGHAAAVPLLRQALDAILADPDPSEVSVPLAVLGATAAAELWDDAARAALLHRLVDHDRRRGAVNALRVTLEISAAGHVWAGDFAGATVRFAESESLYRARGSEGDVAHRTELLAWQGETDTVREATRAMVDVWGPVMGIGAMEQFGHLVRAVAENSDGRYADALPAARRLLAVDPLGLTAQALPEIVEAATRAGDPTAAAAALDRLRERARAAGTPWALGVLARCEALATDGPDAGSCYREAIDRLATTALRTERARTHLVFGEWLRRQHRVADARRELRVAHDEFVAMGAAGFARRARRELAAAGVPLSAPAAEPGIGLTPQERQIAGLAADGATNREIATHLFLSEGTIEYHLTKVFRKLGLTSRRQLRHHLADRET